MTWAFNDWSAMASSYLLFGIACAAIGYLCGRTLS